MDRKERYYAKDKDECFLVTCDAYGDWLNDWFASDYKGDEADSYRVSRDDFFRYGETALMSEMSLGNPTVDWGDENQDYFILNMSAGTGDDGGAAYLVAIWRRLGNLDRTAEPKWGMLEPIMSHVVPDEAQFQLITLIQNFDGSTQVLADRGDNWGSNPGEGNKLTWLVVPDSEAKENVKG